MSGVDLVVVDVPVEGVATCIVCGKNIPAGGGVSTRLRGQILRFKCPGCLSRFRADPDRYLSGGPSACCDDEHEDATPQDPGFQGTSVSGFRVASEPGRRPRLT